ncbi:MAG: hypothetical protein MK135_08620, partial [Polyangiaceae bacterium]|nr:hypothetical protein [Polyangiaceae bacterium]
GTETGVRRVIERVQEKHLRRDLPPWFEELLGKEKSQFTLGLDLDAQAIPAVLRSESPATEGLRAGRLLGNFSPPGLNLVGSLSYQKPSYAEQAEAFLDGQRQKAESYALLLKMMKLRQPLRKLEAVSTDKTLQVALALDGPALVQILNRFENQVDQLLNFDRADLTHDNQ